MNHFSRIVLVFGFLIVHLHNAHGDDGRKQRPAAPGTGDQTTEQSLTTPFRQLTQLEIRLQQELHVARSQGDLQNVRRLESLLLQSHPTPNPQPVNTESPVVVTPADFPSIAPEWGNDVLVRTGVVGISSRRMIAQDVRSNGEIYVATVFEGSTADTVYLFRSTNNGVSWNWFVGFWNGRKMQSIAMHIADTVGGSLIGLLYTHTAGSRLDGILSWFACREDGSFPRGSLVASPLGGRGYSDPSVVSDAFHFGPNFTYWYGAAAHTDSGGVSSGIHVFLSLDQGRTWPIRDTIRVLDDRFPTIEYENMYTPVSYTRTVDKPIRDLTSTYDTIFVSDNIPIGVMHIGIDSVIHTWNGDLDVWLFAPNGDSIELFTDVGGSGDNFINTMLTDSASRRISWAGNTAPFTGFFKPEAGNTIDSTFFKWTGMDPRGSWVLRIYDDAGADTGKLYRWSMHIDPLNFEEIYVSGVFTFGSNGNVRVFKTGFFLNDNWTTEFLTFSDENHPDLASGRNDGNMILSYTTNPTSNPDIHYMYSSNAGLSWNGAIPVASSTRTERLSSVNIFQEAADSRYRIAYLDADSVMYRYSATIGGLGGVIPTRVNQFAATGFYRPEVGSHGPVGTTGGHAFYSRSGGFDIFYDGFDISLDVEPDGEVPTQYSLEQNFPNPFNPATTIRFSLPRETRVVIKLFTLLGEEAALLVDDMRTSGTHTLKFDASRLASGVYFYRMEAGGFVDAKKLILLK